MSQLQKHFHKHTLLCGNTLYEKSAHPLMFIILQITLGWHFPFNTISSNEFGSIFIVRNAS